MKKETDTAKAFEVLKHEGEVDKNYIPDGFESVEDFLSDMRKEIELDLDYDRENREQAMDDKKFSAGEQWDPIVLEQRKGLPCLVINSVPQFTAQLVGDWREGRKAIKVVPTEDGDTEVASIRGDLIRAIEMKSRAQRTYDTTFESVVQCGDGAFRVAVEYARDDVFDQDIFIRPIADCLSVVWDRMSIDPTGRDARHVFVNDLIPEKEFKARWPGKEPSDLSTSMMQELRVGGWVENEGYRVTEYWRMVTRERLLGLFQDGSVRELEGDTLDQLFETHGAPVKTRVAPCAYAQMHLVTGFDILAGPFEYKLNRLPIIRMVGRVVDIGGRRVRYGLVRFMKDPVRLKNFWRSVAAEQLGYAPKAQWIATESAVEGYEDQFRKAHLTRDPLLKVSDEAIIGQNIQRLDPPAPQAALLNEANVNTQDMKDVTGIHDASLGIRSNETSGRAISARQKEGDIASITYYDNGNASVLEAGDVINQLISQVYDATRIIRVIGEDEEMKFAKINDPADAYSPDLSVGTYDVALTTGTSYSTRRAEAAQSMMEAVQVWPQLLQVAGDIVAKAQDWPGADKLAERIKKTIPPHFLEVDEREEGGGAPTPSPEELQQMMQQLQQLQMENQQLKADKSIEMEKLKVDQFDAETKRIKVVAESQFANSELGVKTVIEAVKSDDISEQRKMAEKEPKNGA